MHDFIYLYTICNNNIEKIRFNFCNNSSPTEFLRNLKNRLKIHRNWKNIISFSFAELKFSFAQVIFTGSY